MPQQLAQYKFVINSLKQVLHDEWVNKGRVMDGFGLAIYGDDIKVVSNSPSLRGGPDFVHLWWPMTIHSYVLLQAIEQGGQSTLVKIMMDLQVKSRTTKQENLLNAKVQRFGLRVSFLQLEWTGATRH